MDRQQELEAMLRRSFDDRTLTRAERDEFERTLHSQTLDPHLRDRLLALAFDLFRGVVDGEARDASEWLKRAVRSMLPPGADRQTHVAEAYFSERHDCSKKVTHLLEHAGHSIDICVFTVTHDVIADAILRAHGRGVAIRLASDDGKATDKGSDIERLGRAGVDVRVDRSRYHMHHKFAIFDRRLLLTGSFNWTRGADRNNRENFVVLSEPRLIDEFQEEFELVWESSK